MLNLSNIYKHMKPNNPVGRGAMTQYQQPQINGFKSLFKAFLEKSDRSLNSIKGVKLGVETSEVFVQDEWPIQLVERLLKEGVKPIKVSVEDAASKRVVAIDTSSIKVAVGSKGVVIAIRGALVIREWSRIWAEIIGPFMVYIDYDGVGELLSSMLGGEVRLDYWGDYQLYNSVQKVLAGILEKRLQEYAVERFKDTILLFDGSLSAGPLDNPTWLVSRIIDEARPRGNDILAFSKTSILRVWGELITSLKLDAEPPYVVEMTWAIKELEMRVKVLGETYLARLSAGGEGFRVDAAIRRSIGDVLGSLLKSDSLIYGYPETLILAHDLCTFNKMDLIAMQSILRRRGVRLFKPTSIRWLLFRPIDGGEPA